MAKTLSGKELNRLLDHFEAQGCTVKRITAGYRILSPNGTGSIVMHLTLSDKRGMLNLKSDARKVGILWPEGG
jgi:hypothetical protein